MREKEYMGASNILQGAQSHPNLKAVVAEASMAVHELCNVVHSLERALLGHTIADQPKASVDYALNGATMKEVRGFLAETATEIGDLMQRTRLAMEAARLMHDAIGRD